MSNWCVTSGIQVLIATTTYLPPKFFCFLFCSSATRCRIKYSTGGGRMKKNVSNTKSNVLIWAKWIRLIIDCKQCAIINAKKMLACLLLLLPDRDYALWNASLSMMFFIFLNKSGRTLIVLSAQVITQDSYCFWNCAIWSSVVSAVIWSRTWSLHCNAQRSRRP